MEAKRIGGLYDGETKHQAGSVWDKEQISPTIVAMRGRNPDNPSDRTAGIKTEQRLEPNSQGICNTLTSVQKDNLVLEQQGISTKGKKQDVASALLAGYERSNMTGFNADNAVMETVRIKQATKDGYIECEIGGVADLSFPNSTTRRGRVQDGGKVSPTLMAGEQDICRIEKNEKFFKQALETLEENDYEVGDTINAFNKSVDKSGVSPTITTRPEGFKTAILPVVQKVGQISSEGSQCGTVVSDKGIAPNLVAGTHGYANNHIQTQYRIRKLTPKECWRLMDFKDEDFEKAEKVNSNSQLYKQAGNSIVKNVLMAIFGQMIEGKENMYKER